MKYLVILFLCISLTVSEIRAGLRIIDGTKATKGQFPWAAFITARINDTLAIYCGGTLIHDQWILTAAQCLYKAKSAEILLGTISRATPGVTVISTNFKRHPDFDISTLHNDLAMIKLPKAVTTSDVVKVLETIDNKTLAESVDVTTVGWGKTASGANFLSTDLYYVNLKTIPNADCEKLYPATIVTKNNVCTTGATAEGICEGDGGGALIRKEGENTILVGVSSFRNHTCDTASPSGYTRTYEYSKWIKDVINAGTGLCPSLVSIAVYLVALLFVSKTIL